MFVPRDHTARNPDPRDTTAIVDITEDDIVGRRRLSPRHCLNVLFPANEVLGLSRFIMFGASPVTLPVLHHPASFPLRPAERAERIPVSWLVIVGGAFYWIAHESVLHAYGEAVLLHCREIVL